MHGSNVNIGIHIPRFPSSVSPGTNLASTSSSRYPLFMPPSSTPAPTAFFPAPETMQVLFTREQIAERTRQIRAPISEEYAGTSIVLIGALTGAAVFLAD